MLLNTKRSSELSFCILDTETTGFSRFYNSILDLRAEIRDSADFSLIASFSGQARPPYYFLPHPSALLANNFPLNSLITCPSERELLSDFYKFLADHGPLKIWAHNACFDFNMISNGNYRNLACSDLYQMKTSGNQLLCSLELVRMISFIDQNCGLIFPTSDNGNFTFRLEDLCPANGIEHVSRHTAAGDVSALVELLILIKKLSPQSFELSLSNSSKQQSLKNIFSQAYFLALIQARGSYDLRPLAPIAFNKNKTQLFCADLSEIDLRSLPNKENLPSLLRSKSLLRSSGFCLFPINQCKIILSEEFHKYLKCGGSRKLFWKKASSLRRNHSLRESYLYSESFNADFFSEESTLETQIYDGFFSPIERKFINAFNAVPENSLSDLLVHYDRILPSKRLISLANRILAENYPQNLSASQIESYFDWCINRLYNSITSDHSARPWLTHHKAMAEISDLKRKFPNQLLKIMEIEDFYKKRKSMLNPAIALAHSL